MQKMWFQVTARCPGKEDTLQLMTLVGHTFDMHLNHMIMNNYRLLSHLTVPSNWTRVL